MFALRPQYLCFLLPCLLCACEEDSPLPAKAAMAAEFEPTHIRTQSETLLPPDPAAIEQSTTAMAHSIALGAALGARRRLTTEGLPKNSRQTAEGYWIGSLPSPENIQELYDRNVRLILTASIVPTKKLQSIRNTMRELGITHIYMPFGSRFPSPAKFIPTLEQFSPDQVYIHCEHGGDRSGAILAYILNQRHGWDLARSLYAVIVPSYGDIQALTRILNAHGIPSTPDKYEHDIGIYSAESNGGYGGLKVYAKDGNYVKLVNTLIDTALKKK